LLQQADPNIGDRSFLSFASRLIQGSTGDEQADGMLRAVEGYWQTVVNSVARAVENLANKSYEAALLQVHNQEYEDSIPLFETSRGYLRYSLAFLDKWREFREWDNPASQVIFDQPVLTENAEIFLKYQSMDRAAGYFMDSAALGSRFEGSLTAESTLVELWRQGSAGTEEALERERIFRESMDGFLTEIDALLVRIDSESAELRNYQSMLETFGDRNIDTLRYVNNAYSTAGALRIRIVDQDLDAAIRFYTIVNGDIEGRLAGRRA
jgi:hypothetical protein